MSSSDALVPRDTEGHARRKKMWWVVLVGVQVLALARIGWAGQPATLVVELVWFLALDTCFVFFMCIVYATLTQTDETTSRREQLQLVTDQTELDVPVALMSFTARTRLSLRALSRESSESVFWCALLGVWVWSPFVFMSIIKGFTHSATAGLVHAGASAGFVLGGFALLATALIAKPLLFPSKEIERDVETRARLEQKREQLGTLGGELSFAEDAAAHSGALSLPEHGETDGGLELAHEDA